MKLIINGIFILLMFSAAQCIAADKYNVMSYNILCVECGVDDWEVAVWIKRRDYVFSIIETTSPDMVGLQEVMGVQLKDIYERFGDIYSIKYADAGALGNEDDSSRFFRNVSLIKKSKLTIISERVVLLPDGEENDIPSDDGAKFDRSFLELKLKDNIKDSMVYFINTHFDSHSGQARRDSGAYLNSYINSLNQPVLLVGDFNSEPETTPIQNLVKGDSASVSDLMCDYSKNIKIGENVDRRDYCEDVTYLIGNQLRIDYIFGTPEFTCTNANRYGAEYLPVPDPLLIPVDGEVIFLTDFSKTLPSDHVAITCEIVL
ncbi:endonuclease/exonuclease/phosphatase family protein [Microbulbifer sp. DLAB2-AF]|uniref:endonuclease/exonuclease/phosphatase family protein n=1 Tax=Microbulbifer sp. DLAB2-AF TaxID=3243395 RepID=UPI0040391E2E